MKSFVFIMKVNICKITVQIASFDKVKFCILTVNFCENVIHICKKADILVYFSLKVFFCNFTFNI